MAEKFDLLFGDKLLGTVLTDQTDLPSSSGQIQFNPKTLEEDKELQDFIQFSRDNTDEMMRYGGGYYQFRNYQFFKSSQTFRYQSFVNSPQWCVVSKDGARRRILAPVFFKDNGIVFTLD